MRNWFITGASRKIAILVAKRALAQGDTVVATARNPQEAACRLGRHPNLLVLALDVTDDGQASTAVEVAVATFGRIDVLVNGDGFGLLGAAEDLTEWDVEWGYYTNVLGLVTVTRAVLPVMRRQMSGHIINLSSIGGYGDGVALGNLDSTRYAVKGLTGRLAAEAAPYGIRTSIVESAEVASDDPARLADTILTMVETSTAPGKERRAVARSTNLALS